MDLILRRARPDDAAECGRIMYEAFKSIADQHNFAPDFSSRDEGVAVAVALIAHPRYYSVVAELDGKIAGSNFMDERSTIAGIGPITVDPSVMNRTIGRRLMLDVMERARGQKFPGVRLVQIAYHYRSLSLYTKLGFDTRETLSAMFGPTLERSTPGYPVRPATERDVEQCDRLCHAIHGHDRDGELRDAVATGEARVVEHLGHISGYATWIGWAGHAVGETNEDLKALIAAATTFQRPGFLVPTRNGDLMRWCLDNGLRIASQATLMTVGLYNEPGGRWLPSILY
ncbi:MAG TPA: GNAT family N-acetyltransferase [Candidatus Dormibacteraeota bacterium]|nr:GNAT family N-acetyltransferase [Candidatus Dormibacteraeota bacterium]